MAGPSGAELREGFELAGQRITDHEGLVGIGHRGVIGFQYWRWRSPQVDEAVGGGDRVQRRKREKRKRKSNPLTFRKVKSIKGGIRGQMVAVEGFQSEKGEVGGE